MSCRRKSPSKTVVGAFGFFALVLACERRPTTRASEATPPLGSAEITSAEAEPDREIPEELPTDGLVEVNVRGEPTSFVVRSTTGASPRIVFLHGMCSAAQGYLESFEATARANGGVLGLTGDKTCVTGEHSFTVDPHLQQRRIDEALEASVTRKASLRPPEVVIGYSQGAVLAEKLAAAEGYPYVVLIGSPREPSPSNLQKVRAVVMISGEHDLARRKMMAARDACEREDIPAHYIEIPGAQHGELPDGNAVIGEALRWMGENGRPSPSSGGGP